MPTEHWRGRPVKKVNYRLPGEWLIDNFYIIQEQIVQLKEDLPVSCYKKLPRLSEGKFVGYSRVYEPIVNLAELSDNVIDQDNVETVVQAFQRVETLKLGELWAVPIMIRLVLINRLSERAEELLNLRSIKTRAEKQIDNITRQDSEEPGFLLRKLVKLTKQEAGTKVYLTALARRLQNNGLLTEIERNWFDYKFRQWNTNLEDQLRAEAQETSRLHLSIQNAIISLRKASESDWSEFVENNSVVERILRLDPARYYGQMDFKTRDIYRKKIEKLSAHSRLTEQLVAEKLLVKTESQARTNGTESTVANHVGYYLLGPGYRAFCRDIGYRAPLDERLFGLAERHHSIFLMIACTHGGIALE
ncbi:MAG: hypothetical protein U5K69_08115 [Balneolaceae bacterium]|nr:hypothetical protein [Balneolaceae bacterium]